MNNTSKKLHTLLKAKQGFTMVELMVSIAIMVIVLSVILINYRKFDSSIGLKSLVYDMGLSIRKAQTYGISVKGIATTTTQSFIYPYGIHFDATTPQTYFIFVDTNFSDPSNRGYDANDIIVETFTVPNAYKISGLLTKDNTGNNTRQKIDITFLRPNPDATVYYTNSSGSKGKISNLSYAEIDVTAVKDNTTRAIKVRATGQISISQ